MNLFGFGGGDKDNSTKVSSTNTSTDSSANVGGDGYSVGSGGSSLTIQTLDGATVAAAMDTVKATTADAFDFGARSLDSVDATTRAITDATTATLNTVAGMAELNGRNLKAVEDYSALSLSNNTGLATALAGMVTESKKDPNNSTLETVTKYGALALGAVALAAGLYFYTRKK